MKCSICKVKLPEHSKFSGKPAPETCKNQKCIDQFSKLNKPIIALGSTLNTELGEVW